MSPLQQARQWIADQAPSKEEIQETIDNLCHAYARPAQGAYHEDVFAAISFLMTAIGGSVDELVLPEKVSAAELDIGLLGENGDPCPLGGACSSEEEKKRRFEYLKASLQAPF
ncbi:hypothetical protein EGJ28_21285 [Stutzerimonas xanthomarina]|jgi:hypothetical protein|uniref:Uncharacterized protein n=1 Tax=Stutzerimonas xanthomarina TaxID=271420 RepID=A0A427DPL1_9GAMM|nr:MULTISPECIES: hypothetical protein [Stutzerimonas]KIL03105.1 hypothetical protein QX25_18055 [Stutzerimonas stutzeri]MBK3919882.1 hypothetical protein [Stutzerimonas frequens]RRV05474.1 hypothetical protein EGJ28_21285 [Stutzerimonas xanthomarina]